MNTQHHQHRLPRFGRIALALFGALVATLSASGQEVVLKAKTDRPKALYEVGERVLFRISVEQDGKPADGVTVAWTLSKDGVEPIRKGTAEVVKGRAEIEGSLAEPGFLQCRVELPGGAKPVVALAGAGVSPLEIKPSMPAPDDFDAFWAGRKAALSEVPANVRLTPAASSDGAVEVFDLQADCIGAPVSGYLARPAGAKPGSLPAILTLHGAGVRSASAETPAGWARTGLLALDINAHGLPNGKSEEYYKQLAAGELKGYSHFGRESRDEIYFHGMFLRVLRALDALAAQPEWDGRTLVVRGSSQGGAQAIAAAGLDKRVTFFVAGVTAMADHTGAAVGRVAGWPKLVPASGSEALQARIRETSRYYDMVNFAARSKAPAYFTVGFIDTTCPPTTVYAAYNVVRGRKAIFHDIEAGHVNTPEANRLMRNAVLRHVRTNGSKLATAEAAGD